jgi:hypothetical protein
VRKSVTTKFALFPAYFLLVILLIGGVAINHAWSQPQTDGNVCDSLTGAAYGLCNSYCNAMKCGTEDQHASDRACERVLRNFRKHSSSSLLPSCDPCYNVTCYKGESCVNGECQCGDVGACEPPTDTCDNGECVDPCADLAANGNECPCNFFNLPTQNPQCWGPTSPNYSLGPFFEPCYNTSCTPDSGIGTVACALATGICTTSDGTMCKSRGIIVGANPATITTAPPYFCVAGDLPTDIGVPACFNIYEEYLDLTSAQFQTCLCRIEQYADELAQVPGSGLDPSGIPYSCYPQP